MSSDALESSDSDDDREQARLQLLKKKRHCMDDRARSIREKEPKQALRGPRMRDAVAVDSSGKRRPFPSHVRVARLIAKTLPMVKRLPHNVLVEFTRLMNERTAEGSAVACGQPLTEGKKAGKVS